MKEASGCGFYPGPGVSHSAQQDRLRKCSLATVEPAHADIRDTQHEVSNSNTTNIARA